MTPPTSNDEKAMDLERFTQMFVLPTNTASAESDPSDKTENEQATAVDLTGAAANDSSEEDPPVKTSAAPQEPRINDSVLAQLRETAAPAYSITDYKKRVKQEKERLQQEKEENARLEKDRRERERVERLMLEKAKAESARQQNENLERERLEREKYERAKQERHRLTKAKAEGTPVDELGLEDTQFDDIRQEVAKRQTPTLESLSISAAAAPIQREAAPTQRNPAPQSPIIAQHGVAASVTTIPMLSDQPAEEVAEEPTPLPASEPPSVPESSSQHDEKIPASEQPTPVASTLFASFAAKGESASAKLKSSVNEKSELKQPKDAAETKVDSIHRRQYAIAVGLVLLCVATIYILSRAGLFHSGLLGRNGRLMVTTIENRTGDKTLDGVVAQALNFELQDSPQILLRGDDAYRSATNHLLAGADKAATTPAVLARQAAEAAGAKAYLYGTLRPAGAGYLLTVEILNASSNRRIVEVQESAASRDQIMQAVDRAATRLRAAFGERVDPAHPMLVHEATADLEALQNYSVGEAAALDGKPDDAIAALQDAVKLDPKFVQAQIQLSWLDHQQHAESASAAAAQLANKAATGASEHTQLLANFAYEFNTTGNLDRAESSIRRFVALDPHDAQGALGLTRLLRAEGRLGDAVDAAKRGLDDDPYNADLYAQCELALIGLDRYDDALALEQKSQQNALAHDGIALTAAYLADKKDVQDDAIERIELPDRNATSVAEYGVYLDETGQIAAGATLWQVASSAQEPIGVNANNRSWLLAQGALDRALIGDCEDALAMAKTALQSAQGTTANFNAGVAAALCGNGGAAQLAILTLDHDWSQSAEVRGHRLPILRAAVELGKHNDQGALDALKSVQANDPTELSIYLRGVAEVGLHQTQAGIADLQAVLAHPGLALTGGGDVYPAAQIALARAYDASGDKNKSVEEYKKFLNTWRGADATERFQVEALNATGQ